MAKFQAIIQWVLANYGACFAFMATIIVAAKIIARLTPTEKDDAIFAKMDKVLKAIMDFLKIPNNVSNPEVK